MNNKSSPLRCVAAFLALAVLWLASLAISHAAGPSLQPLQPGKWPGPADGTGHMDGEDVVVSGNYAYVANGEDGLQVIDVRNPAAPVRVGGYDTPGVALA